MVLELMYDAQDLIPENVRDLYTEVDGKFTLTGVNGLKTQKDVDAVKEALRKEREEHAASRNKLKTWGSLDPEQVNAELARIKELETIAGGKLDETKINELVENRLTQKTSPLQRQIEAAATEKAELAAKIQLLESAIDARDRGEAVRGVALEMKVHVTAIPDIELAASMMFEKDFDGKLITKSGIPGVTPGLEMKAWFKEMQKSRPHWWPESEGGGAKGSGGISNLSQNPFTHENWNMSKQAEIIREYGEAEASRLAKLAGTTIGKRPPPRQKV